MTEPTFEEYLRGLPREEAVRVAMADQGIDEDEALMFVAIVLGESSGDVIELEEGDSTKGA